MEFKEANDAVASKRILFCKNQNYKSFLCVTMKLYVVIFGV